MFVLTQMVCDVVWTPFLLLTSQQAAPASRVGRFSLLVVVHKSMVCGVQGRHCLDVNDANVK
jgi:hypothetical protein